MNGVQYACGYDGYDPDAAMVEQVQCEMCGEPVMPGRDTGNWWPRGPLPAATWHVDRSGSGANGRVPRPIHLPSGPRRFGRATQPAEPSPAARLRSDAWVPPYAAAAWPSTAFGTLHSIV